MEIIFRLGICYINDSSYFHSWLKLKLQFSLKYIIWSSRLKKVQLKFTTLQIIFNFPFECKQINQTIANNSTPYHQRRGKKSQSTFQTRHFPRIRKISLPSPRKGDQLFFRNFTISSINKPSNYKIAHIYTYPSSRACGWRWWGRTGSRE